jgi:hypothetical protein
VYGCVLADQVIVADLQITGFTSELHILGLSAQYCVLEHTIALTQPGEALHNGVCPDFAARADLHIVLNNRIGTDADIRAKFRSRSDNCGWVNLIHLAL